MGTLLNQTVRDWYSYKENSAIRDVIDLSKEHGISLQDTIDMLKFMEMKRANDLYKANGDIHDEQMAGLGELLTSLNKNIKSLKK